MSLGFMILYLPNQTLRFEPCHLVSHSGRPARDRLCTAPNGAAAALFPSPAFGERCHRSLARRLVAVDRRAVFHGGRRPTSTSTGCLRVRDFGKLGAVTFLQSLCHS